MANAPPKEAWRIEEKYSRYRADSVISYLHAHRGVPVKVDEETASLLDFAQRCYRISDGMFDITSGILRQAWTFDGSDRLPEPDAIAALLPYIGFEKLKWQSPTIELPAGMELDLGGIGKEYAVDRAYELLSKKAPGPFLINFGGDLRASGPPPNGFWQVGIEKPDHERDASHDAASSARSAGDQRRLTTLRASRWGALRACAQSQDGVAGAARAQVGDRSRQQLHGGGDALNAGDIAWRQSARVSQ